jgi:phosphotransferase system HPr-like phosphotransfer protein
MEVLMLAATIGTVITVTASSDSSEEEEEIMQHISSLISNKFNEGE